MRSPWMFAYALFAVLPAAGWAFSCSSAPPPTPPRAARPQAKDAGVEAGLSNDAWMRGHLIALVPDETFGPYIGYREDGAMALYSPGQPKDRFWVAQAIGPTGMPSAPPQQFGHVSDDNPQLVLVRPAVEHKYLAGWVNHQGTYQALQVAMLADSGKPLIEPATVAQIPGNIVWADALVTADQTLLLWAEQRGVHAAIQCIKIDSRGKASSGRRR